MSAGEKTMLVKDSNLNKTVYPVLFAISFTHLLNDTLQAIVPAIYPILKENFRLSYMQIGLITFVFQMTASVFQPIVGSYTDRKPAPYSLSFGMGFTLIGLLILSMADSFPIVLLSVAITGFGSAIFHPEASRTAFIASGGKRGMAQSLFQVGGNAGSAIGPLLAALVVAGYGLSAISWFSVLALLGGVILFYLGRWSFEKRKTRGNIAKTADKTLEGLSERKINTSIGILLVLVFSKYIYMVCIGSYYTFFLIDKFGLGIKQSQFYLFICMAAVALGTYAGGPIGDRIGRRQVIWFSILGAAPFALLLPYANLFWTNVLAVMVGLILSSAFSAILVYAQELKPGKEGTIAGLFFGFAFGVAGIGSAALGLLADVTTLDFLFKACSFLPLLGILAVFLPKIKQPRV
ncbi:MAG: Fosmidomycin resistance protein [Cytophagaceae bacterium SCN 52-12]|nr:MAG: Fosmidomycin resistance protein [Cytophagaceae bacterium SCN 52-12]